MKKKWQPVDNCLKMKVTTQGSHLTLYTYLKFSVI